MSFSEKHSKDGVGGRGMDGMFVTSRDCFGEESEDSLLGFGGDGLELFLDFVFDAVLVGLASVAASSDWPDPMFYLVVDGDKAGELREGAVKEANNA